MDKIFINESITDTSLSRLPGLFYGKMGICLYLFHIGYTEKACELLKTANEELPSLHGNIQVSDGLCGVGLSINYFINCQYITGNINTVAQEIDDRVFKQLAFEKYNEGYDLTSLIHILYYLVIRWDAQEKGSEAEYLYRGLITQTVNDIYKRIEPQIISEPLFYSLDYILPQVILIMDYLLSRNLCKQRIERMMGELSPIILSTIPRIHANRLYLLCGIDALLTHGTFQEEWKQYRSLLFNNIDVDYILTKEMGCKSIYVNNGVASLYFLIRRINEYSGNMNEYRKQIMAFIDDSPEWNILAENKIYRCSHLGLYNGICGVALAYNMMEQDKMKGGN